MNRQKALDVLELPTSATPHEIRSGYLDLVKVWHPDRFVNDPALQAKAQDKLRLVIEAYESLISSADEEGTKATTNSEDAKENPPSAAERPHDSPTNAQDAQTGRERSTSRDASTKAWIAYFGLGLVVLVTIAAAIFQSPSPRDPGLGSLESLRLKADRGDVEAQTELGYSYFKGESVPRDLAKALYWWRTAAERGDAYSQNALGLLYFHGEAGVPKDYSESARWYRMAARQGGATAQTAQYNLARMYTYGLGVTQDLVSANMWASLAASISNGDYQMDKDSEVIRDSTARQMTRPELAEAQRRAREWRVNSGSINK